MGVAAAFGPWGECGTSVGKINVGMCKALGWWNIWVACGGNARRLKSSHLSEPWEVQATAGWEAVTSHHWVLEAPSCGAGGAGLGSGTLRSGGMRGAGNGAAGAGGGGGGMVGLVGGEGHWLRRNSRGLGVSGLCLE
jgi:hypothetical protein